MRPSFEDFLFVFVILTLL